MVKLRAIVYITESLEISSVETVATAMKCRSYQLICSFSYLPPSTKSAQRPYKILHNFYIWGLHRGDSEDSSLLVYHAVSTGKELPTFRIIAGPSPSKSTSLRLCRWTAYLEFYWWLAVFNEHEKWKEMSEVPGPSLHHHVSFSGFTTTNYGPDCYGTQVTTDMIRQQTYKLITIVSKMFLYYKLRSQ